MSKSEEFESTDRFSDRHIGPGPGEVEQMLVTLKKNSVDALIDSTVPAGIRLKKPLSLEILGKGISEAEILEELRGFASKNEVWRTYIGMGYSDCFTPPVILRNILENPGWYTQYTPYQAEISQGRLEALLNFQTMIADLTAMEISNASLLDEGTAAAEAMAMCFALKSRPANRVFLMSELCHPQTIAVVKVRADAIGVKVAVGDPTRFNFLETPVFGVLLQYPGTNGAVLDYSGLVSEVHAHDAMVVVAADLLSLTLLKAPGEWGADIVVGSAQRFGVPMGYGGPHAAFMATRDAFKRQMPGRIVGVSKDADGKPAIRLALQTREQHIRRDKATSNICTAQVLLAIMASMYAVYHGREGLKRIASRVHFMTRTLAAALQSMGHTIESSLFFDTIKVYVNASVATQTLVLDAARAAHINLRVYPDGAFGVSLDEMVREKDLSDLLSIFAGSSKPSFTLKQVAEKIQNGSGLGAIPTELTRKFPFLAHPVFNRYHSETEMLRYMARLQSKDLSLAFSMIPLGSCTMKLNATTEMLPVTWPEFGKLHPFIPREQAMGYTELFTRLEKMLAEITGFDAISLQPNAGSQGEYAGLLVIREYHRSRGEAHRNVCLIPSSAHGTNPASAALAGMKVVVTKCDSQGNVDLEDLRRHADEHASDLAALMVTYPSTHGVFEEGITEICAIVHSHGGQVYMDGANMNAQVGLCRPGDFGPDVCHLNLHKTFCIPHGGGGPGMGPIGVKKHLAPFLPSHPIVKHGGIGELEGKSLGPVSAATWGSASILPISYAYIRMMGASGLRRATEVAILNANYIATRLDAHYPVLYKGRAGNVAHECIVDLRQLKASTGVEVEDVAKRLMDYGFHAPTVSFPVPGTMMIEPTESESKAELDRFCDAMISIREEITEIEKGRADRVNNVLKHAPHTAERLLKTEWDRPYSREKAAFPLKWVRETKFWPAVARIDSVYGERNLICSCPGTEEYQN